MSCPINSIGGRMASRATGVPGALLRIGFPQSLDDIPEYFRDMDDSSQYAGGHVFFNATQQDYALQAMQAWANVANIGYTLVPPGEEADIYLYAMEFTVVAGGVSTGITDHGSRIAINTANDGWSEMAPGTPGFHTLMHEFGHSLGLSHPGDYDGGGAVIPTYEGHAEYIEDTMMYSVMSYFQGEYTGFDSDGKAAYLVTPRSHDIYVMQYLYGADWEARDGNRPTATTPTASSGLYDFTNFGEDEKATTKTRSRSRITAAHDLGRRRRRLARSVRETGPVSRSICGRARSPARTA